MTILFFIVEWHMYSPTYLRRTMESMCLGPNHKKRRAEASRGSNGGMNIVLGKMLQEVSTKFIG